MRPEDLYRAIGEVGEDLLEEAENYRESDLPGNIISIEDRLAQVRAEHAEKTAGLLQQADDLAARETAGDMPEELPEVRPVPVTPAASAGKDEGKKEIGKESRRDDREDERRDDREMPEDPQEAERRRKGRILGWQQRIAAAAACLVLGTAAWFGWNAVHLGSTGGSQSAAVTVRNERDMDAAPAAADMVSGALPETMAEAAAAPETMAAFAAKAAPEAAGGAAAKTAGGAAPEAAAEEAPAPAAASETHPVLTAEAGSGSTAQQSGTFAYSYGDSRDARLLFGAKTPAAELADAGETAAAEAEGLQQARNLSDGLAGSAGASVLLNPTRENPVCSPLNIALALSMLAETTGGESRQQILDLLGAEDLESLRTMAAGTLAKATYENEQGTSLPAGSLWLRNDMADYSSEVLQRLAEIYGVSSYEGTMGSDLYNALFRSWLNEQTHELLAEQTAGQGLEESTMIAIAAAIYYHADWAKPFQDVLQGTFHGNDGDTDVEMLSDEWKTAYYRGEHYGAVRLPLSDGLGFWLFLPDEGYTPETILADDGYLQFMKGEAEPEFERTRIRVQMPKFDLAAQTDLIGDLQALGVTDIFDSTLADFSPLLGHSVPVSVDKADHAARVKADEYGLTAAAYTVFSVNATTALQAEPPMEFICDRPFLFAAADESGLVWFEGLVNAP